VENKIEELQNLLKGLMGFSSQKLGSIFLKRRENCVYKANSHVSLEVICDFEKGERSSLPFFFQKGWEPLFFLFFKFQVISEYLGL
jgi:hypothetical protein